MALTDFNEFNWRAMTSAINQIVAPPMLLQDLIFRTQNTNAAETIDVDVVIGGKYVAPFVSPVDGGTIIEKLGRQVRSVKAPRIRLKKPFSASELLTGRAPGSGFYVDGAGSISQYRQQKLAQELQDLKNRIIVTKEWMCSQALTGTLTVTQDNLAFAVDYNLPAAHKPTLTSTYVWGGSTADIIGNFMTWSDLIINAVGIGPDIAILGATAFQKLREDEDVYKLMDNRRNESGQFSWKATSNYLGNLLGIDLYRYGTTYTDSNGVSQKFVADNVVILAASKARFSIEHGIILDLEAEAQVMSQYFAKSWVEKDPSVAWILAESRPLPVPWQPEAIVYATVV